MKFIILTEVGGEEIYIASNKILALQRRGSTTFVTCDSSEFRILETAEQIIKLINQQEQS